MLIGSQITVGQHLPQVRVMGDYQNEEIMQFLYILRCVQRWSLSRSFRI